MRPATTRVLASLLVAALAAAVPAAAGGVAVLGATLSDNGDHDGFADTNETVEIRITVRNDTGAPLSGLVAILTGTGGRETCVLDATSTLGDVAPGEIVEAADPFVLHVAPDVERGGAYEHLTATFEVTLAATGASPVAHPAILDLDLDLDADPVGPPSVTSESFEGPGGFGSFEVQNLDLGLHDDADAEFGAADGWRCQYHEPFCTHASCFTDPTFQHCSPGATAADADAIWWRVDGPAAPGGGRARTGDASLHFGVPVAAPDTTTPTGVLEAVMTTDPIALARGSWCAGATSDACDTDDDCQSGGACVPARPELSFAHQASFVDDRLLTNVAPGETADRGIVAVQLALPDGTPAGPWIAVEPHTNPYDSVPVARFTNCSFDPIDDGSTGDDLDGSSSPWDGLLRRGPSSTCADRRVFATMGSTSGPFDAAAVGDADGPGLSGSSGPGTWVESRVDLSRFAGRSVRIRFLASTTRVAAAPTWESAFQIAPHPGDDGWWIDDVEVRDAAATPGPPATADAADNAGLPTPPDTDGDAWLDACDTCPSIVDPDQNDADGDRLGDPCDPCTDLDGDGFGEPGFAANTCPDDNCPATFNPAQDDPDGDGLGSACDRCPAVFDPDQYDSDLDGSGDACDCAPADDATYPGAPEVNDGLDNQCPGESGAGLIDELTGTIGFFDPLDRHVLSWPEQVGATMYAVGAVTRPVVDDPMPLCEVAVTGAIELTGTPVPPAGWIAFYVVRPESPNAGSWGATSAGAERVVTACD